MKAQDTAETLSELRLGRSVPCFAELLARDSSPKVASGQHSFVSIAEAQSIAGSRLTWTHAEEGAPLCDAIARESKQLERRVGQAARTLGLLHGVAAEGLAS